MRIFLSTDMIHNLRSYLDRLPWWAAISVVLGYGLFVGWDTGDEIVSAWKASLISNLSVLGWQLLERRQAIRVLQAPGKSKNGQIPRTGSDLFLSLGFLFLAILIIIAHVGTFHLVILLTFSREKELWGRAIESFSDVSTLAVLPFALWMTKQAAVSGVKAVKLWEHSMRLFLVVWVCYGITLLNIPLGEAIRSLFNRGTECPACPGVISWWVKISYFLGIYLFLSIPPERIWNWSEKYLKVSPRRSENR